MGRKPPACTTWSSLKWKSRCSRSSCVTSKAINAKRRKSSGLIAIPCAKSSKPTSSADGIDGGSGRRNLKFPLSNTGLFPDPHSMTTIRRALISVSHKSGVLELSRELKKYHIEIISTGGTAKLLTDNGIDVVEVSDYTGFPEMLDGRVKTLHPKIHGGLLGRRDIDSHVKIMRAHGIPPIDLVVVNLYP